MRKGVVCKDVTGSHERPQLLNPPPKGTTHESGWNGHLDRQLEGRKDPAKRPVRQRPIVEAEAHDTR